MELLEVDCGNGVEQGLGSLNIPPNPTSPSPAKSEGNLSFSSPLLRDLQLGAAMRGDLWPIVIYVVVGSGVRGLGRRRGEDGSEA
ncbi:hypothetical protein PBY51_008861 [Eleginops maclovinus]|uniref:Uncharacterized protein n=1 Tax=Eleginops maclovinus TaxID=56733 RepID=A0AAN7WUW7_ELEMC|nr:hypothetical protein PBY51_008861 [Eleginops maclovinus]